MPESISVDGEHALGQLDFALKVDVTRTKVAAARACSPSLLTISMSCVIFVIFDISNDRKERVQIDQ